MRIAAHGIEVYPPPGWEARISRTLVADDGVGWPVLHAANFELPNDRGDFGSGAVEVMQAGDVFVSLLEYDPVHADSALFSKVGMPRRLGESEFAGNRLQRAIAGQGGYQRFFTDGGRAFCLYIVLGSHLRKRLLIPLAESLIATIRIDGPKRSGIR